MNEHLFYDLKDKPALTRSLATQIVQELGRRIVAGAYGQGDLLEDEGTLAGRYQVSPLGHPRCGQDSCRQRVAGGAARHRHAGPLPLRLGIAR